MHNSFKYINLSWAVVGICENPHQPLLFHIPGIEENEAAAVEHYVIGYMAFWHIAFVDEDRLAPCHDDALRTEALNPHTLTFRVDGEIYRTSVLSYGADIVVPEIAEREGYTFSGWGDVAKTMPDNDLEYDASFTVNQYTLRYLIDGIVYKTYTIDYGTAITPEGNPEDDDYFYAWEEAPALNGPFFAPSWIFPNIQLSV